MGAIAGFALTAWLNNRPPIQGSGSDILNGIAGIASGVSAIVGGIFGAIAGVVIGAITGVFIWYFRSRREKPQDERIEWFPE